MGKPNIIIVDYQAGNLRSVQKALELFDVSTEITCESSAIEQADGVVFPGQGACDSAVKRLRENGLDVAISKYLETGKPFLGVCLGLQLLLETSEEGFEPCLGLLKGRVRKLGSGVKIPHMGWNQVNVRMEHPIFENIPQDSHFYFVHSYYADVSNKKLVAMTTTYGIEFCSAVAWNNIAAVQFHPEKSGNAGLILYHNFVRLVESTL